MNLHESTFFNAVYCFVGTTDSWSSTSAWQHC